MCNCFIVQSPKHSTFPFEQYVHAERNLVIADERRVKLEAKASPKWTVSDMWTQDEQLIRSASEVILWLCIIGIKEKDKK